MKGIDFFKRFFVGMMGAQFMIGFGMGIFYGTDFNIPLWAVAILLFGGAVLALGTLEWARKHGLDDMVKRMGREA
jgi:hypothetical protein